MASFQFWRKWLFVVAIALMFMGLAMVGLSLLPGILPGDPFIAAFWRGQAPPFEAARLYHWLIGVWGATIAGWGLVLAFLVQVPVRRKEKWAWQCLLSAVLVWYPLDTFLSLHFGVVANAILNTVILGLILSPLALTRRAF
ncbi:MAG: hypothetical protein D6814_08585 [Calditrichaeota bacterium]|nr:MAG: hypothetical protein D6814_08585 [Calditrichota bacterium]